MGIELLSASEARNAIRERLMSDWIAVIGDMDGIVKLENNVYPPGTVKNRDFEMIGFNPAVFVAKKTDDLKNLLGNQPDFDRLILLTFHGRANQGELTEMICYKTDKKKAVLEMVSDITEGWR